MSITNYEYEVLQREADKQKGWRILADKSLPLESRKAGLLMVIGSHYDRSVAAYRRRRPHGSWKQYVGAWLLANGPRVEEVDVVAHLQLDFPPAAGLSPGRTYWGT